MDYEIDLLRGDVKKNYINPLRSEEPKTDVLFVDFIDKIVSRKAKRHKTSYVGNYRTLVYHLNNFCEKYDVKLYTNSINEEFLEDFICYLEALYLKKTYIRFMLTLIKAMVKKAGIYGYSVDWTFDEVDVDDEETPAIYLTQNEIARIYYFKGLTKKQERIRDLFIVGCYTALRYSDLNTLTKENVENGFIVKVSKKSNIKVVIPIHDFVKEIYEKYDGFPNRISSQHFNRYIKMICKKVGINKLVYINYTKGGEMIRECKEKWQLISSHTARRSGATNLMNTGRIRVEEIMRITGHKSEKSFRRYIKTTKEDSARHMSTDNFFKE
jgi:integrase